MAQRTGLIAVHTGTAEVGDVKRRPAAARLNPIHQIGDTRSENRLVLVLLEA